MLGDKCKLPLCQNVQDNKDWRLCTPCMVNTARNVMITWGTFSIKSDKNEITNQDKKNADKAIQFVNDNLDELLKNELINTNN